MKQVGSIEAFMRYIETDQPYESKESIYPYISKIKNLRKYSKIHIVIPGRNIYHARESWQYQEYGIEPESGVISCSVKMGCKDFARNLMDPVYFKVNLDLIDWYVYVPDVAHELARRSRSNKDRLAPFWSRINSELEFIVGYKPGILKRVSIS